MLLVTLYEGNQNKLLLGGPLGLSTDFIFTFTVVINFHIKKTHYILSRFTKTFTYNKNVYV